MSESGFSREEIRLAVREALLQALPSADKKSKPEPVALNCQLMKQILESAKGNCKAPVAVDLSNERKLNEFAIDLAKCMQDQNVAGLIRSGRMKFRSSDAGHRNGSDAPSGRSNRNSESNGKQKNETDSTGRIETGVLTESKVLALAKNHSCIEVSRNVILTPLARDRARRLKLEIVRQ
ncbi:MAG: hypothetical protein F4082_04445 [Gammaproteobacteria bacterium]|nr:hypothetical protein [Gammaproteobacteria bacterium]